MGTTRWVREGAEMLLGLGLVTLFNMVMPDSWVSSHILFSTFFLVVFAVALRYQRVIAYTAGLLAALIYVLFVWYTPVLHEDIDLVSLLIEPFLLLLAAIVASDSLRAQRRHYALAIQKQARTETLLQETTQRYKKALEVNAKLEEHIAEQTVSLATISQKMLQLWKLGEHERYGAIVDLVMHAIEADMCSFYLPYHGCLRLCVHRTSPSTSEVRPDTTLRLDDPIISRILRSHRVSTILEVLSDGKREVPGMAVMAGPLLDQDGQIVGILVVDSIALLKFTPATVRLFDSMLQIASLSLQTEDFTTHLSVPLK
jgi:hypothetical protein